MSLHKFEFENEHSQILEKQKANNGKDCNHRIHYTLLNSNKK